MANGLRQAECAVLGRQISRSPPGRPWSDGTPQGALVRLETESDRVSRRVDTFAAWNRRCGLKSAVDRMTVQPGSLFLFWLITSDRGDDYRSRFGPKRCIQYGRQLGVPRVDEDAAERVSRDLLVGELVEAEEIAVPCTAACS